MPHASADTMGERTANREESARITPFAATDRISDPTSSVMLRAFSWTWLRNRIQEKNSFCTRKTAPTIATSAEEIVRATSASTIVKPAFAEAVGTRATKDHEPMSIAVTRP